ncbi:LysR family transcriptional regulator [Secundilactobacillus malefermentans DSM 5705 = KCTC 3548]|nr:LysR family transcriptional regulator [Secundilactobacillus malefermentans DSM 5705 = KCTC 3548]
MKEIGVNMDTRKLATFVDLAQTNNYSKTAERLYSTQATVSKHILSLEKEWHVMLFSRAHRTVSLTAEGKKILPLVNSLLEKEHELQKVIELQNNQRTNSLIIKTIPSVSQYGAFNVITEFAKQQPQIELKFNEVETDSLFDQLADESADIIFTRLFDKIPRFDVLTSEQDYFVALLPKTHPLAKQKEISANMLKGESFLLLDDSTQLLAPVVASLREAGVKPDIIYEGKRIDLILGMLNRGMGVSIMMNKSFDLSHFDQVVAIPITPLKYSRLAFVRTKKNQSSASDQFWKFAQQNQK